LLPEVTQTEERIMDGQLHLRVNQKLLDDFKDKCDLMKRNHQHVIREMMEALVEGRLTMKQNEHQKEIYND
jgi:hypothetical protein